MNNTRMIAMLLLTAVMIIPVSAADAPNWQVKVATNPLYANVKTYTFSIEAIEGQSASGARPVLEIEVSSKKPVIHIRWHDAIPRGNYAMMAKLGKNAPVRTGWGDGYDKTSTIYVSNKEMDIVRGLLTSDTLQVETYSGSPKDLRAVFNVKGLKEAAQPFWSEIGW
ncbi:MAG: hypothetical protein EPN93_07335 [Spirochaetes bacterium]|nr:MAG: hypothetical protein EPN93_07335 [Spirochaetota bacterium]